MPGYRKARYPTIPIWVKPAGCVQTDLVITDSYSAGPEGTRPALGLRRILIKVICHMSPAAVFRRLVGAAAITAIGLGGGLLDTPSAHAQSTPGLLEFRWDTDRDYRKLYYYQTSATENDRSEWFLLLRAKDRKTAFIKLTVTVPDYFDAKLRPERISLCRTKTGGMTSRTRCLEEVPATVEINDDQTAIEVFPDSPVSVEGDYGLRVKLFNPQGQRMYQLNALMQAPGDVPLSAYVGSWLIDVD